MDSIKSWRERAACVGKDPTWWDIDRPDQWPLGIAVCRDCPVQLPCYTEHRRNHDAHGIYGGIPLSAGEPVTSEQKLQEFRRATILLGYP